MKQKELLFLLISITFVAIMWIVFSVLHQALSSTISEATSADIQPISASFDLKTLQELKNRKVILPQEGIEVTPTPTPTPAQIIAPVTPIQFQFNSSSGTSPSSTPIPTVAPITPFQVQSNTSQGGNTP